MWEKMARVIDKDERRLMIVHAAIGVFMESSVQKTTMQQIAKAADVSKGSLYEYFKNKDELIVAVFEACNVEMGTLIKSAIADEQNPLEQLRISIETVAKAASGTSDNQLKMTFELWTEVMQTEESTDAAIQSFRSNYASFHTFIKYCLTNAKSEKLIKDINVEEGARTVMAIIDGIFYHSVGLGVQDELYPRLTKAVQTFVDALRT